MESVGEDQEMKGSDWASAMRILTDMEHDQQHDGHDRCAALRLVTRIDFVSDTSCATVHPG